MSSLIEIRIQFRGSAQRIPCSCEKTDFSWVGKIIQILGRILERTVKLESVSNLHTYVVGSGDQNSS